MCTGHYMFVIVEDIPGIVVVVVKVPEMICTLFV